MNEEYELTTRYHLPEKAGFSSIDELIDVVVEPSDDNENWWGGFKGETYLVDVLESRYKDTDVTNYQPLNKNKFQDVKATVNETTDKIADTLPPPHFGVTAHVYPWFQDQDEEAFGGVNGKTFFGSSFHIYLDTQKFTRQSLQETVAHEYNHAVRNQRFSINEQTIGDAIVMEGLAEHFREGVIGGNSADWSTALSKSAASKYLQEMESDLDASINNQNLYKDIFYDSGDYPLWTGYSIGYQLVGKFIEKNHTQGWPKLMKTATEDFFAVDL